MFLLLLVRDLVSNPPKGFNLAETLRFLAPRNPSCIVYFASTVLGSVRRNVRVILCALKSLPLPCGITKEHTTDKYPFFFFPNESYTPSGLAFGEASAAFKGSRG